MIEEFSLRENTNVEVQFTLYANDAVINLSSAHHITLRIKDAKGNVKVLNSTDSSPQVAILIAASGSVGWTPATGDLIASRSPYHGYWDVYDATGAKRYSVPNDNEFLLTVTEEF